MRLCVATGRSAVVSKGELDDAMYFGRGSIGQRRLASAYRKGLSYVSYLSAGEATTPSGLMYEAGTCRLRLEPSNQGSPTQSSSSSHSLATFPIPITDQSCACTCLCLHAVHSVGQISTRHSSTSINVQGWEKQRVTADKK